jgi:hypothetical protein
LLKIVDRYRRLEHHVPGNQLLPHVVEELLGGTTGTNSGTKRTSLASPSGSCNPAPQQQRRFRQRHPCQDFLRWTIHVPFLALGIVRQTRVRCQTARSYAIPRCLQQ